MGDKIEHIELRKWADIMFIAPLCNNYLTKIANGLCDDLLVINRNYLEIYRLVC